MSKNSKSSEQSLRRKKTTDQTRKSNEIFQLRKKAIDAADIYQAKRVRSVA